MITFLHEIGLVPLSRKSAEIKDKGDTFYRSYQYKKIFKKIGVDDWNDDVGIEEIKVIENKTLIKDYIESEAKSVGIDYYKRNLALQGVDTDKFDVKVDDKIVDLTPFNNLDPNAVYKKYKQAIANFESLPNEIKKGMSAEQFIQNLNLQEINDYFNSLLKEDNKHE